MLLMDEPTSALDGESEDCVRSCKPRHMKTHEDTASIEGFEDGRET